MTTSQEGSTLKLRGVNFPYSFLNQYEQKPEKIFDVIRKRKMILGRKIRRKERRKKEKEKPMVFNFGCILELPETIYKSLCLGQNPGPNKSEFIWGENTILSKAPQLLLMCTPMTPLHCMWTVYYRKTELISVSFSPHVGILKRDELVLFPKLWQFKATWADSCISPFKVA